MHVLCSPIRCLIWQFVFIFDFIPPSFGLILFLQRNAGQNPGRKQRQRGRQMSGDTTVSHAQYPRSRTVTVHWNKNNLLQGVGRTRTRERKGKGCRKPWSIFTRGLFSSIVGKPAAVELTPWPPKPPQSPRPPCPEKTIIKAASCSVSTWGWKSETGLFVLWKLSCCYVSVLGLWVMILCCTSHCNDYETYKGGVW